VSYIYIYILYNILFLFFPLSKGQKPYRETCAWHSDKTSIPHTHTHTHTHLYTHIRQMARSSLGGSGSDGDGGYLSPRAWLNPSCTGCTASLNAKRASLTNLFFIPPLSFFITGLWTFTRRPSTYDAAPFLNKCV